MPARREPCCCRTSPTIAPAPTRCKSAAAAFGQAPADLAPRCAIGAAAECVERLRAFVAAGCSKFVLFPLCPPDELVPQIERYAREIIARF
jgi:alkanesulfonate monooxygenase SsuD/methylene tetrahydromethanopterin reductase-like flavin-dependent oxidoreductase (luciferase family)